ncbi:unnamed protein product [[Candida] boidinii]|nr:unnamed protein product [[Candida] boidinii]
MAYTCNNNTVGSGDAGWGARRRLTPHLESPDGSSVSNSNQYPPPPRPPPMQPRKHIHLNNHSDSSLISGIRRL